MDTGDRRVPIAATAWGQMSRPALRTRRRWPFRTDLALLGLIAVQPLEQAVPPDAISPTKVAGAICLITLILDLAVTGRALRFDGADAILLVLLAMGCASTLVADSPSDAVATTVRLGGFVALFVITTQFVDDPRLVHRLLWVLSLSAAVASMLAISNMLGGVRSSRNRRMGTRTTRILPCDHAADDGLVDPSSAPLQTARRRVLRHDVDGRRVLAESRCVRRPRRRCGLPGVDGTSRAEGDRALVRGGGGGGGGSRDDASSDVVDGDLRQRARGRRERRVARRALARSRGPGDGAPVPRRRAGELRGGGCGGLGPTRRVHRRSWCTTHIWRWRPSSGSGGSSRSSPSC